VPLSPFDPEVARWFAGCYGRPTDVQARAWAPLAAGEHLLVVAPTGSGKTLTGFLWPLDRLATGAWEGGGVRVLYVSPLKALNADIERNLVEPLAGIAAALAAAGREVRPVRVGVRSGDTPPAERARMLRRPPEILITTPESLNLLLLARRAETLFTGLRLVILDEIHAVVGSKRGTHLITAVERLTRVAGEFQRVAISATVRPAETVAAFVAGHRLERGAGGATRYVRRPLRIVESRAEKRYELAVRSAGRPTEEELAARPDSGWLRLAEELRSRIAAARSTLIFTNSRRLAERLTRLVNEAAGREVAWSHHGSLARELRTAIERRLKEGALPAIVATSSLELGIDVGALDQVLMVQAPRSLASAAQRVGRAGHRVGETSRGAFYPTHARDYLDCAVAARAVLDGEIEPVVPVRNPLDLLAQTLLALVAGERWRLDELYDFVRTAEPFHELPRALFDLVVEMLAGRYAEARIPELKPRLAVDRLDGAAAGRPGLARLLARAGGTIPDRGYFQLKLDASQARLGELDEEFVWERSVGDTFVLGAQAWRIVRITAQEVLVAPARGGASLAPFWRADARDRGAFFSERVAVLLERLVGRLDETDLASELAASHALAPEAAGELVAALREARAALGGRLPHRRQLVFEECAERAGAAAGREVILYTFWGGAVNRPLALALAAAWEEREGEAIETVADDDAILLVLPEGADPRALLASLDPERVEELLRRRLESTGFFGAHFRQNAQRALLLPRAGPARRTPLWLSRQNAKKLLEAVSRFDDFPLLLETWRTCLQDEFELEALRRRLAEVASGEIRVAHVVTPRPSPLAANLVFRRTNELMYEDDVPETRRASALRGDLLREMALSAERPTLPPELVERYRRKAQRLLPGYAAASASELLEWVKERLFLPWAEWRELEAALDGERQGSARELVTELGGKLVFGGRGVAARETLLAGRGPGAWLRAAGIVETAPDGGDAAGEGPLADFLTDWLRYQAALPLAEVAARLGQPAAAVESAVARLVAAERAVAGALVAGAEEPWVAGMASYEALLRWRRAEARPAFEPLPLAALPLFVADHQGLTGARTGLDGLQLALERLFGYAAPAGAWEREILPARVEPYQTAWLDTLCEEQGLRWRGAGQERMAFVLEGDLGLVAPEAEADSGGAEPGDELANRTREALAAAPRGLDLAELAERLGAPAGELVRALWALAWRGLAANDTARALRQGALSGFEPEPGATPDAPAPTRRSGFRRWSSQRLFPGRWQLLPAAAGGDPLAAEASTRERARLVLDRYGVVFRELLAQESPELSWGRLARALRALELAGEIVAGHFFAGVPGLQFATPEALRRLREGLPEGALWWLWAGDPASLCGVDLPELKSLLPARRSTTHLAFVGSELRWVSRRSGRELEFRTAPDDPVNPELLAPLRVALTRAFDPARAIEVETINGEPAARSPYLSAFGAFAATREGGALRLRRRYSTGG